MSWLNRIRRVVYKCGDCGGGHANGEYPPLGHANGEYPPLHFLHAALSYTLPLLTRRPLLHAATSYTLPTLTHHPLLTCTH